MVSSDPIHYRPYEPDPPMNSLPARDAQRRAFLSETDFSDSRLVPMQQDASFRRYFRLDDAKHRWLLMDAPPQTENLTAWLDIGKHLTDLGLRVPAVLHSDVTHGFALIEDFGDQTFTRLLDGGEAPDGLYEQATDLLTHLHRQPNAFLDALKPYDLNALMTETVLLPDWFLPLISGKPTANEDRECYQQIWEQVFASLPTPAISLVLRDFHVDNLMRLAANTPLHRVGLLDFQDALIGPMAYDLMSLLEDARRDLPPAMTEQMQQRYFQAMPFLEMGNFQLWYRILAAQRHCKVAGIFSRLALRDDKPNYLAHIPRVLSLLQKHLDEPLLRPLADWLRTHGIAGDPPEIPIDYRSIRRTLNLSDGAID
ncbi:MAG TPA: aminoglycoside phosphotransferase [Gammaproteobacteria bacterium]|nr:aminoglycoside phosphotransferase [Gammaproteobacteria bacterium]